MIKNIQARNAEQAAQKQKLGQSHAQVASGNDSSLLDKLMQTDNFEDAKNKKHKEKPKIFPN